ncbi:MAG: IMP dehydrogenase [Candidatus Aenigmatarchaeota archaeon]
MLSSPMDKVTGSEMSIVMAREGALGVIHRNLDVKGHIDMVKRSEKWIIRELYTVTPNIKVPLLDEENRLQGLITVRDIEKKKQHPEATLDENGQLMVAAAVGPGGSGRIERLVDAGIDLIVVDTAHGNPKDVIDATEEINGSFDVDIMAGNIASQEGARALIKAGAGSLRVGIIPGSICTTRIVSGIGVPQITAIMNVFKEARDEDVSSIADGGIIYRGDAAKALACGAGAIIIGNMLAGTEEAPGRFVFRGGRKYKEYREMASISALEKREKNRYDQDFERREEYVPEVVEGLVPYKDRRDARR